MAKRRAKARGTDIRNSFARLQEYAQYLQGRGVPPTYIYRNLRLNQLYLARR
jgi:hypothetical protein